MLKDGVAFPRQRARKKVGCSCESSPRLTWARLWSSLLFSDLHSQTERRVLGGDHLSAVNQQLWSKKKQIPIYFWFQQLIGSDQWLTVDVQFLFSDPDPIKLNKVHHPADTKAALEAPAGSDSPATTCKVPQKQAAGPDLGKPGISAASPLSEHSSPAHVQLLNSAEDANEAQLHLPTTATSTKPSSEERFPSKLIQPAAEAAEPPKGGSGEHFAKTG